MVQAAEMLVRDSTHLVPFAFETDKVYPTRLLIFASRNVVGEI